MRDIPGEGQGNPPQCSCLANPMQDCQEPGRPVHGVVKLDMAERLNNNNLNANDIFHRNRTILRWVRNHKGPRIAKANLKKENKLEASHFWTSHYITKLPQRGADLAQKQALRPEAQDREPRKVLWACTLVNSQELRSQGHTPGKGKPPQ